MRPTDVNKPIFTADHEYNEAVITKKIDVPSPINPPATEGRKK